MPPLTQSVISYLDSGGTDRPFSLALLAAFAYFASSIVQAVLQTQNTWIARKMVMHTSAAVGDVVYRKALRLAHTERQRFGIGSIVSYMQVPC